MSTVPVNAPHKRHVETDPDDRLHAELKRQIDRMEAAIAAPSDFARFLEEHVVHARPTSHAMHVWELSRRAAILGDLEPGEFRDAVVGPPPGGITRIKRVGPGDELPGIIDGDYLGERRVPREVEVDVADAGAACDDDSDFALPVGEPVWATAFGAAGSSSCFTLMRALCRTF